MQRRSDDDRELDGLREDEVAQIVHDLKRPLATIALETDLLDQRLAGGDAADVKLAVARITHNVVFLDRMVQDLLDLCSLDAGHFLLREYRCELRTLLESVIERVVPSRERQRVLLDAPLSVMARIDELRIERVVSNFLENALKYAPPKSAIVVRLEEHDGQCCVSVSDTGPGLTTEESEYVFDKYRRADSAVARGGSGLGLYVSKKIVEAHGGRIGVDSKSGVGSRFFFEIPLH